ncbi:MAG: bifunctional oligoribonuclease/PAP phosphatase NrnA [Candidatus Zixiibacteriota bacterium]
MTTPMTDNLAISRITRIQQILEQCRRPLVVSHIDPDGDAIGTQLAFGSYLQAIGKSVNMLRESDVPAKYLFLPGVEQIAVAGGIDQTVSYDVAVVLECPSLNRLGTVARFIGEATKVINIDHHPENELQADVSWVDVKASSVGEMAYDYFRQVGFEIEADMATNLYAAILTDTGRFRFESTTPHTLAVAGDLVRAGADPRMICDRVYYDVDPAVMKLTGRLLSALEYYGDGRICIMPLTRQMLVETGASIANTEGLVDYAMYTRGVQAGALLRELENGHTKVSLRSRNSFDIAAIAGLFGGGGHPNAAGCTVKLPLELAKREIVRLLLEAHDA